MSYQSYTTSHTAPNKGVEYDQYYDKDSWRVYLWEREREVLAEIRRRFFEGRSIRLLDFACGTGRILSALEDSVESATGVDVSPSMLAQARRKLARSRILEANVLEGNVFEPGQFNLITAFRFFVNAEPPLRLAALRTLHTLLADDGLLVFNNHHNRHSARRTVQRWIDTLHRRESGLTYMTIRECRNLIEAANFELVAVYSAGLLYVPRLELPRAVYYLFDRNLGRFRTFACLSESPVFVVRKKTASG